VASERTDVGDVKHIIENKKIIGDVIGDIVDKWDAQKDEFYEKTRITRPGQIVAADSYFEKELENLLGE
jgi:snRNA-activating protein complex subunit 1